MSIRTLLGSVVAALAVFIFGFLYWAINPLPYATWNTVDNPAAVQAEASRLFPESGLYFIPGPGNDPEAVKLLNEGPALFLTINHSPVAGPDPMALLSGFGHNLLTALLLALFLKNVSGLTERIKLALVVGVLGIVVINGSEIIWWMQPLSWIFHQAIYYLIYFALSAAVLNFFLPRDT